MIPQVGGFQGCYLDNHRNNWRCARAVRKRLYQEPPEDNPKHLEAKTEDRVAADQSPKGNNTRFCRNLGIPRPYTPPPLRGIWGGGGGGQVLPASVDGPTPTPFVHPHPPTPYTQVHAAYALSLYDPLPQLHLRATAPTHLQLPATTRGRGIAPVFLCAEGGGGGLPVPRGREGGGTPPIRRPVAGPPPLQRESGRCGPLGPAD